VLSDIKSQVIEQYYVLNNTFFLVHFTVQKTVIVVIKCIRGRGRARRGVRRVPKKCQVLINLMFTLS
jgi:hypothetical protein